MIIPENLFRRRGLVRTEDQSGATRLVAEDIELGVK